MTTTSDRLQAIVNRGNDPVKPEEIRVLAKTLSDLSDFVFRRAGDDDQRQASDETGPH